ncbi:MAG TPA: penicillin-binding transpeptidase domain-containing protein [Bacteroidota bacterium]|nr:penicillin-binding transpeptidase domain-containing protein [Bacteroidota bacterium]
MRRLGRNADVKGGGARAPSAREWHHRVLAVKAVLLMFFLLVVLRLVQVQVIDAGIYKERARRQYEKPEEIPAERGTMYDRSGHPLVTNARFISFGADPSMIADRAGEVAERFASVFSRPRSYYLDKFSGASRHFVWLERGVNPSAEAKINVSSFPGLITIPAPMRLYPYGRVAAQVLGFTGVDNNGLSGLELELDSLLRGENGRLILQRDGLNRERQSVDYPRVDPVDGDAANLTIDAEYQSIAEDELRKGIERNKAESGLVAMMDPATGEILAMANYPGMDPADPSGTDPQVFRNRVVTDMFEPGSVFKIVTASAALEGKKVDLGQKFNAEQGSYTVRLPNGKKRNTINDTHKHGIITFQEAMEVSSNIVMAKVSDIIGADALFTMARAYGFGTATGIELPGEVRGELKHPSQWSGTTLNSMAYGYEVGVTPLQILCAYAAVANHGVLMKPFIVRNVVAPDNTVVGEHRPETIRRVVSRNTAAELTQMFRGVVERGTGMSAKLPNLPIAGKTGTAKRVIDGKYTESDYTASFAGFFPAQDPVVACIVMIENPRDRGYTGGLAAAPVFRAIAERIYATSGRFRVRQTDPVAENGLPVVPDVTALSLDAAKSLLRAGGFEPDVRGTGSIVVRQSPAPGLRAARRTAVELTTSDETVHIAGPVLMPDVRGLAIRRALTRLALLRLDVAVQGSGVVVSQDPGPREHVREGSRVLIRCEARTLSLVTAN